MKLENEIKQKAFRNPHHKLIVNILYTGIWMTFKNMRNLKPYRLTLPQYNVLRILRGQYPDAITVNTIIDRMLDKSSNASRIVDKLVEKKLAEKKYNNKDRRAADVKISKNGLKLLGVIDRQEEKWIKEMKTLTTKEAKLLNELLDKLRGKESFKNL